MLNNHHPSSPIQRLSDELLVQIALCLDLKDVSALALTCRQFGDFIFKNNLVFRRLVGRDFGITYKQPDEQQTWIEFYKSLHSQSAPACCPHLSNVPAQPSEIKRVLYHSARDGEVPTCDVCQSEDASYLDMTPNSDIQVCRSCVTKPEQKLSVVLEWGGAGALWCTKCKETMHKLGGSTANPNEEYKVKTTLDYMNAEESADERRKAEHQLYVQELRREDMDIKHYLVEKNWARSWMMFRTREGSPLPGRITNQKLARQNGTLNPNIRLPVDKYRPAPETHADIISEKLWTYLRKAYGVSGAVYSEDDVQYPEYTRLKAYIDHFKSSILAYP